MRVALCVAFLWLLAAVPAGAAVDPDHYLTSNGTLDKERVFHELRPDQVLELAREIQSRGYYQDYIDAVRVLVRQARFGDMDDWDRAAKEELIRFQRSREQYCQSTLDAIIKETGKQDRDALYKALRKVQAIRDEVRPLAAAQEAWAGRAMPLLNQVESMETALRGLDLAGWLGRKDQAATVASDAARLKGDICRATDLAEARAGFQRMTGLVSGLDDLGTALDGWQRFSSQQDNAELDARIDALARDGEQLLRDTDMLTRLVRENEVEQAIAFLKASESSGPDMKEVNTASANITSALVWHSRVGDVLAELWPEYRQQGMPRDQSWRDDMGNKLRQVTSGTDAVAGKASTSLTLPGGKPLSQELQETMAFNIRGVLDRINAARAAMQAWRADADFLAVRYGQARADLAAGRDCLTNTAKQASGHGPPPTNDNNGTTYQSAYDTNDDPQSLDSGADSTGPDQPGPDQPGPDGGPDNGPDGTGDLGGGPSGGSGGGSGSGGHGGTAGGGAGGQSDQGWTFNNSQSTDGTITSTGYHVFAAGSRLGWAAGLSQYSVGPADQTIVEHLNAAGDHVFAAYQNSRAPLLAWPNHPSIRADLARKGENLLTKGQQPGSRVREQLASALHSKMLALANAVAIQVVANRVEAMENCESKYHRLGYFLAYAHQVLLIAEAMDREGMDRSLVNKVRGDGKQKIQSAINTLSGFKDLKLASGACAPLTDLMEPLRKALSVSDLGDQAWMTGTVWAEAGKRIASMSEGGPYTGDPGELSGTWGREGDTETLTFETSDGVHYKGYSSEDGLVAELTMTAARTYTGKILMIIRCNGKVTSQKWVGGQRIVVNGMTATCYMRLSEKTEKPFEMIMDRLD